MMKWSMLDILSDLFKCSLSSLSQHNWGLGLLRKAWPLVGPYKTYLMSVTIFWILFLIPHLLSEHKQLMIHVHPLSPIRYLQPSLNLLLWLASSIFWNRKYWRIIIIPNNSIHARVCWAPRRWTQTPAGGWFSVFSGQPWQIYWGHRILRRRRQGGSQPWPKLTHRWVLVDSGPRTSFGKPSRLSETIK